jgi:hypothetical protein
MGRLRIAVGGEPCRWLLPCRLLWVPVLAGDLLWVDRILRFPQLRSCPVSTDVRPDRPLCGAIVTHLRTQLSIFLWAEPWS